MVKRKTSGDNGSDVLPKGMQVRLDQLRRKLLQLHKILLDAERAAYEREHGRKTSGEILQLLINHEQFAWLHRISEFVVRIDEILEDEDPSDATTDAAILLTEARSLLMPSETGDQFGKKYYEALQRQPDAVLAHKEVAALLSDG